MWTRIADGIIRFRLPLMGVIAVITAFMAYHASRVEMSYEFTRTVPPNDPDMVFLSKFREQFGEDGNMVAIGLLDSTIYQLDKFQQFAQLSRDIRAVEGVNEVLSLPRLKIILKDTAQTKFRLSPLFPDSLSSQRQLDSLLTVAE